MPRPWPMSYRKPTSRRRSNNSIQFHTHTRPIGAIRRQCCHHITRSTTFAHNNLLYTRLILHTRYSLRLQKIPHQDRSNHLPLPPSHRDRVYQKRSTKEIMHPNEDGTFPKMKILCSYASPWDGPSCAERAASPALFWTDVQRSFDLSRKPPATSLRPTNGRCNRSDSTLSRAVRCEGRESCALRKQQHGAGTDDARLDCLQGWGGACKEGEGGHEGAGCVPGKVAWAWVGTSWAYWCLPVRDDDGGRGWGRADSDCRRSLQSDSARRRRPWTATAAPASQRPCSRPGPYELLERQVGKVRFSCADRRAPPKKATKGKGRSGHQAWRTGPFEQETGHDGGAGSDVEQAHHTACANTAQPAPPSGPADTASSESREVPERLEANAGAVNAATCGEENAQPFLTADILSNTTSGSGARLRVLTTALTSPDRLRKSPQNMCPCMERRTLLTRHIDLRPQRWTRATAPEFPRRLQNSPQKMC